MMQASRGMRNLSIKFSFINSDLEINPVEPEGLAQAGNASQNAQQSTAGKPDQVSTSLPN